MLLLIDNFDSFTYNLVHAFWELGHEVKVARNDAITLEEIADLRPSGIILGPGPGTPHEAGITLPLIGRFGGHVPLLGICLGHQAIGLHFGAKLIRAREPRHGKPSSLSHSNTSLFKGLPQNFLATRYHSLTLDPTTLLPPLQVHAQTEEGDVMGIAHQTHPIFGLQFHPESIATKQGMTLLSHFGTPLAND